MINLIKEKYAIVIVIVFISVLEIKGQEGDKKESPFSVNLDLYSNYMFRGTKFGEGPAFQPYLSYNKGGFTIGTWGSFDASGYMEADLYALYEFGFGLKLGITDYYYPMVKDRLGVYVPASYFDISKSTGNHAFELNLGYAIKGFSLSANYIINEAGGAASIGGDKYFELGYEFDFISVFAGAGDGWHTSDGKFDLCNIGVKVNKELALTEKFSIPVTGALILNPDKKLFNIVVGLTF
jgi:uncharacterized protein (TIGR02001 family)